MAAIDRTAYPQLPSELKLTEVELTQFYTPRAEEIELVRRNAVGAKPMLSFLVLLKTFQRLGYFPQLRDVPNAIWQHLQQALALPEVSTTKPIPKRTSSLYRYHNVIRTFLKVKVFDDAAVALLTTTVTEAAQSKSNPADLINVALEILIKERYELPAFSNLDKLVQTIRTEVNNRFCDKVLANLFVEQRRQLDMMLSPLPDQTQSDWVRLREVPKSASLTHLQELFDRYNWLVGLVDVTKTLTGAGLPPAKIRDFAAQAKPLQAGELRLYNPAQRYTLMLCHIQQARTQTRDNLIETFLKRIAFFHSRAKEELQAIRERQQETTERLLAVLNEILLTSTTAENIQDPALFGTLVRQTLTVRGGVEALLADCEAIAAYNGNNHLSLVHRYYKSHRTILFQLVRSLKFVATSQDQSLKTALTFLLDHEDSTEDYLPATLDLSFTSDQWQRLVKVKPPNGSEYQLVRRQLEICVFSALADDLKNGDMAVTDSENFADYRQQLLPWADCLPLLPEFCDSTGLPATATEFISQLQTKLTEKAAQVDAAYPDNGQFEIAKNGELIIKKMAAKKNSPNLKKLEQALKEQMPARSVLDILCNVQHYTHFTRHFGPPSGSDPKIDNATERYILTTFCYGCNLGPAQLMRHLPTDKVKDKQLSYTNFRHIDDARLQAARTDIVNAYNRFELPHFWGDGSKVGADGTKYELAEQNLVSEYHIRYGGYGGIMYHFVSDTYIALFSRFITCGVWEGAYILDLFSKNKSDIQPTVVHSDTQGQNLPIFALAYLLGIQLMPRIRNVKDLIFYRPYKTSHYEHIDSLFTEKIDWELIERHWQDLMRVALSIKAGVILPSTLLRRLNNYSRKNRLYQAMRELGRAVRTIYLLQYISDGNLRVQVTAMTNKVEIYHSFSNWFFFGGEGQIAENDPVEQDKRTQYLDLVADAAIYQNTVDMSRILKKLAKNGLEFDASDVAALSPYLTRHIKRFGDYVFDLNAVPDPWDGKLEIQLTASNNVRTIG